MSSEDNLSLTLHKRLGLIGSMTGSLEVLIHMYVAVATGGNMVVVACKILPSANVPIGL